MREGSEASEATGAGSRTEPREARAGSVVRADTALGKASIAPVAPPVTDHVVLVADRDDDDADGVPDGEQQALSGYARADLVALDSKWIGASLDPASGRESARLVANGRPLAWGERIPRGTYLQGLVPGRMRIVARTKAGEAAIAVDVVGVGMREGATRATVDLARSHASIERTPPARVDMDDPDEAVDDPDALRVVVATPPGGSLGPISVESVGADGATLDTLRDVRLLKTPCTLPPPAGEGAGVRAGAAAAPAMPGAGASSGGAAVACAASAPLRFVVDEVDRAHALVASRSVRAEVGGAIVVRDAAGRKLQAIRVAGPRASSAGPVGRYRIAIRPVVMRVTPGGAPAVGGTDAGALASIRQELAVASATWGQCGISFGPPAQLDAKVMSPPPPYLVALGDDVGLPASGGEIRLSVDGKPVTVKTKKGWSTRQVALELQRVAQRRGFSATLSENARISPGVAPSVDVALAKRSGELASVSLVSSSDATLTVGIGAVDLTDGLQHFGDTDSVAGTLEERALVKAVDDGDPRTVEVIVVPFFAGGGRIGESFIASDGSSMRNVVILDRAGVRARRTSLTLAHELGHVILDEPGHPDDFGVDTPTLLMDSDASDSSPFGPRRLPIADCAKAVRQSGPEARVPLLTPWKLPPLKYTGTSHSGR